jgi:hypothetical protein
MAFGYAIASVAVEIGLQRMVRAMPTGCIVPKWTSAIVAPTTNAAIPAESVRPTTSPASPIHAFRSQNVLSRGIQAKQDQRMRAERCLSPSTQPKLS